MLVKLKYLSSQAGFKTQTHKGTSGEHLLPFKKVMPAEQKMAVNQSQLYHSELTEKDSNLLSGSSSNIDILLKSKNCVDKLGSRILSFGNSLTLNKNNKVFKCVEEATKQIKNTIQLKVENSFTTMINEQKRVKLTDVIGIDDKNKEEATKKLIQDYWQKRQQNESEARRKTLMACKQNRLPRINNSEAKADTTVNEVTRVKKKAIISSLNVKIYEKQQERETLRKNKEEKILAYLYSYMVHVIDYKVQNDTPEFLLFQKLNYVKWDQIDHILKAIESFSKRYDLKYCTLDLQKVLHLIDSKMKTDSNVKSMRNIQTNITFSKGPNNENLGRVVYTPHQLLGCLENSEEISLQNSDKPGIRFYGNKGRMRAIIKIQANWRGKIVYKKILKLRQKVKSLIKIQRAFKIYLAYCRTKQRIRNKCLEKYKWFNEKQQAFRDTYRVNQLTKKVKYEIHICSDGQTEWQRVSTENFMEKQNSYFTRIFKSIKENSVRQTKLIFVTAFPIPIQITNYYFKLLQLGGASDFKNRITFLSPEKAEKLVGKVPLSRIIYYCPTVLKKIKSIVRDEYAYIVPATPSNQYIQLCHFLDMPLYSSNPQPLLYLQTNSGVKDFYSQISRDSEEDVLPFAKNIYSLAILVNQLSFLIQSHPQVWRWIFKIDNQSGSRGLAYVQTAKIVPKKMLKFLKKSYNGSATSPQGSLPQQVKSLSKELFSHVFQSLTEGQKLKVVCNSVYRSQTQFLNFFYSNGGIVEADINTMEQQAQNLCFCVQIQPDNEWRFVNSYKKITIKKQSLSCYFDSQLIQPPIQIQKIVRSLIKRKMFGYFVLSFIKEPEKDGCNVKKTYFNGIKCYLDHYSSAGFMREFISKQSNALYIPYIPHPNIKKISMPTFFHLCRLQNISFDIDRQIGNIFMFLDRLESGCLGMMTFNDSSKVETFIHAAEVLDFFSSKIDHTTTSGPPEQFLLIRNSINGYLNLLRKKKLALKSNEQVKPTKVESYKEKEYLC